MTALERGTAAQGWDEVTFEVGILIVDYTFLTKYCTTFVSESGLTKLLRPFAFVGRAQTVAQDADSNLCAGVPVIVPFSRSSLFL